MSLSGSSASKNSICAIARLATLSSIGVPIKMMLSLRRREKMSYARSPRLVCSTTIGTSWEWGTDIGLMISAIDNRGSGNRKAIDHRFIDIARIGHRRPPSLTPRDSINDGAEILDTSISIIVQSMLFDYPIHDCPIARLPMLFSQ